MLNATFLLPPIMLNYMTILQSDMTEILFTDVMDKYRSDGSQYTLPVNSLSDVVHVNISMQILQLTSLDTETGDAVMEAWLGYYWQDRRLGWRPEHYGNISSLHIPQAYIWKPDIVLYNGHVSNHLDEYNAVVSYHGNVTMISPITMTTRCDLTDYDSKSTVDCYLKFASWTHSGKLIAPWIANNLEILSEFQPSTDWKAVKTEGQRNDKFYRYWSESYPDVTFNVAFREKSSSWWNIFS